MNFHIGIKFSDVKWADTRYELNSKETVNTSLKKLGKKLLTINSKNITHAVSSFVKPPNNNKKSEYDMLKEFDENDQLSINSIEMSVHRRQLGGKLDILTKKLDSPERDIKSKLKDTSDYSFHLDEKTPDMTKSRDRKLEDEMSEESELDAKTRFQMHNKVMNPNQSKSKNYNVKPTKPVMKDDSDNDLEEQKDKLPFTPNYKFKRDNSYRPNTGDSAFDKSSNKNSQGVHLMVPKTAMSRTKSLVGIDIHRPHSANTDNKSEVMENR